MSIVLRCLMVVMVLTTVTGCTSLPQAGAPTPSTTFSITPVKASPSDLDGLLSVKRWKFQITLPQPTPDPETVPQEDADIHLTYRLEVRQAGQVPNVISLFTVSQQHPAEELEVIMFPIDHPDGQPQRWKLLIHGVSTQVIDSPVHAFQAVVDEQPATPLADGSFLLLKMAKVGEGIPEPDNAQLVFSVTERKHH